MAKQQRPKSGLPTPDQIVAFVQTSDQPAGKREIAREFGLKGQEKIALKALLHDMTDGGLIELSPGRAFTVAGGVPKVTVLRIVDIDDDQPVATPEEWDAGTPPPMLRVIQRGRKGALGVGDRILARTEERGKGHVAHLMKKLERTEEMVLGVVTAQPGNKGKQYWLRAVDKKARRDWAISDLGDGKPGDLVLAEISGRPPQQSVAVKQILGDPLAPKSFSEIAIHKYCIPYVFPAEVISEADRVAKLPLGDKREDLTHLPIVAIDPADARDHDDAIWASEDDDPKNPGGFSAIVAIADVSYYVRPGSALDREARKRGNSVYFPDQVVPMLPEILSADMCSLKAGQDRAALACHMTIAADGRITAWRFTRARVRLAGNIAYEDAQAAIDGTMPHNLTDSALKPLWACWALLKAARAKREPLDLDLPERRIELDETGRIVSVAARERLDAHRLVEDFMIAANVAAAKGLEAKARPVMYRVHEVPSRDKLVAMKDFLKTLDVEFALGQVVRPSIFNRVLGKIDNEAIKAQVMEQVLRTQMQAYYGPVNMGHFGLALGSYAHFTSPIRRYADLLVHRSLVDGYGLEQGKPADDKVAAKTGLARDDIEDLAKIGQAISDAERRAMQAERETVDRYVAAYLSQHKGEIVDARITGVKDFGFFATVDDIGGDGLIPVRSLGREYFEYDEASQTLTGRDTGTRFTSGQRLKLRLVEADPIKASLLFELPERTDAQDGERDGPSPARRGKSGAKGPHKDARKRPGNGGDKRYKKDSGKGQGKSARGGSDKGPRRGPGKGPRTGKPESRDGDRGKKPVQGKRGRPANIRHQGKKSR